MVEPAPNLKFQGRCVAREWEGGVIVGEETVETILLARRQYWLHSLAAAVCGMRNGIGPYVDRRSALAQKLQHLHDESNHTSSAVASCVRGVWHVACWP